VSPLQAHVSHPNRVIFPSPQCHSNNPLRIVSHRTIQKFSTSFAALRRLRNSSQVEEDIEEMRAEERAQQSESSISIMELICSPTLRAPLIIGIVMQLSQQLSGINAVSGVHNGREKERFLELLFSR
jgi:hypothetical protein